LESTLLSNQAVPLEQQLPLVLVSLLNREVPSELLSGVPLAMAYRLPPPLAGSASMSNAHPSEYRGLQSPNRQQPWRSADPVQQLAVLLYPRQPVRVPVALP
jgi:hypothetical protein